MKFKLLIIDMQYDFANTNGALYVNGAAGDSVRLANFIDKNVDNISNIYVTLDSHNPVHIAHPVFWVDKKGNRSKPFTNIKAQDVIDGKWATTKPEWNEIAKDYLKALEKIGTTHTIWPPHCIIGTTGHGIVEPVCSAIVDYANKTLGIINYIAKGSNAFTEQFSAYKAAVVVPSDPTTHSNKALALDLAQGGEDIVVAGEALDYCVANTLMDLFGEIDPKRFVLLRDATSSVGLNKNLETGFLDKAEKIGMRINNTAEYKTKE